MGGRRRVVLVCPRWKSTSPLKMGGRRRVIPVCLRWESERPFKMAGCCGVVPVCSRIWYTEAGDTEYEM